MPHIDDHHKVRVKKEPNINPFLIKAVLFMAIVEPLMTAPQVYKIWVDRQVAGVSLITWGFMFLASIVWLTYSLKIKSLPMITSSSIWAVMEGLVVIGILIF